MERDKQYEYVLPKGTVLKSSVGEYTIKSVLGQGGFGITYQAKGRRTGDNVMHKYAIKELFIKGQCWRDNWSTDMKYSPAAKQEVKECMKDFKDEAVRLNRICRDNKNIVNVNEVFEANGTAYYVMEYLEGGSLRDIVRKNGGGLSEGVALSFIRPIAEAVQYIHSQYQLLHCDIKPDNVMLRLDEDGLSAEPVLIDFGISVHFNKKGELTTTHNALGTPGYSPQEQFQGLDTILNARKKLHREGYTDVPLIPFEMDVYALGATLYYLLVGINPAAASYGLENVIDKKLSEQDISEKTKTVIVNAMRQAFQERTKTAADFLRGFEDRYYLPMGFVLRSPHAAYQIIGGIQEETQDHLRYVAVLYTGQSGEESNSGGNATIARRYDVYEYFEKGYSQRMSDESVQSIDPASTRRIPYTSPQLDTYIPPRLSFLNKCREWTGLSEYGDYTTSNGLVTSELFRANGTLYAIVRQGWKPEPPVVRWLRELVVKIKRSGGTIAKSAAIAAGVAVLGYGVYLGYNAIDQMLEAKRMEKAQLEQQIQSNISKANAIIDTDTVQARKYAEWVLSKESDNKDAQAIIAKIAEMNKVAEPSVPAADAPTETPATSPAETATSVATADNTTKQEETAKQKEEERKRQEAEKQEAKKKEQEAVTKQQEPVLTDAQKVQNAIRRDDVGTLTTYANKRNQQAIDALALYYIRQPESGSNDRNADKWSKKASSSVRKEVRTELVRRKYFSDEDI